MSGPLPVAVAPQFRPLAALACQLRYNEMMSTFVRLCCLLCAALALSACAPMLAMLGTNPSLVAVITNLERIKLAADGASYVRSDKTLSDHALSKLTGKECKIFNVISKESVCADGTSMVAADSDVKPNVAAGAPADPAQANTDTEKTNANFSRDQASGD